MRTKEIDPGESGLGSEQDGRDVRVKLSIRVGDLVRTPHGKRLYHVVDTGRYTNGARLVHMKQVDTPAITYPAALLTYCGRYG